jgi:hypothetical protein
MRVQVVYFAAFSHALTVFPVQKPGMRVMCAWDFEEQELRSNAALLAGRLTHPSRQEIPAMPALEIQYKNRVPSQAGAPAGPFPERRPSRDWRYFVGNITTPVLVFQRIDVEPCCV